MDTEIIRVLIADDYLPIRKAVRALLEEIDNIELIGEASDGWEAIYLFKRFRPDVILMDLTMPNLDGIEATRMITTEYPEAKILILTGFINEGYSFPAIKAGALGCLNKEVDPKNLIQSIYQMYQGQPSLDPSIAQSVISEFGAPRIETPVSVQ